MQSNGTVIPNEKVLAALKEANATVKISKYDPSLQPNVEKLKQILAEKGIRFMHTGGTSWRNMLGSGFGQLEPGSAKRRFSVCVQQLCLPYMGGKIHLCGESAILFDAGLLPECSGDYIDLLAIEPAAFAGQLKRLNKRRVISACSYCLGNTYKTQKIPVAAQRGSSGVKR